MQALKPLAVALAAVLLSSCSSLEQAGTSIGCILAPSSTPAHPRCADPSQTPAPSPSPAPPVVQTPPAPAVPLPPRFEKLQSVLDEEIQFARQSQSNAVAALQTLPSEQQALAGPVRLINVDITDSKDGQTRSMRTLDAVILDLPLAAKGRPEYNRAMDIVKNLANKLADNRGSSSITVLQADADVKAKRVNTATGVTRTQQGRPVSVYKEVAPSVPAGTERYIVRAGEIRGKI